MIINSHNLEITEAIQAHIEKKHAKIANKFPSTENTKVYIKQESDEFIVTVIYPHDQAAINGKSQGKELYLAITNAFDKIMRQIKDKKAA